MIEGDEDFIFALSDPQNAVLHPDATESVTITDNDFPSTIEILEITALDEILTNGQVDEGEGFRVNGKVYDSTTAALAQARLEADLNFDGDTDDAGEDLALQLIPEGTPHYWTFTIEVTPVPDDGPSGPWSNETVSDTLAVTALFSDEDHNQSGEHAAIVEVFNVAPQLVDLPELDYSIDSDGFVSSVTVSGTFTDPGTLDRHRAIVTWGDGGGDGNPPPLPLGDRSFVVTRTFAPGSNVLLEDLFNIGVNLIDDDTGSDTQPVAPWVEVLSWETVLVNNDDDDMDDTVDLDQSPVPGEDDLEQVLVKVVNPGGMNLANYQVELLTSGPIELWDSIEKGTHVPSGSTFTVGALPPLVVEGIAKGSGQIIAQLINPIGEQVAQMTWAMQVEKVKVQRNGADLAVGKQTVWVGQHNTLEVVGGSPFMEVAWIGLDRAIANYTANNATGKVLELEPADLDGRDVSFYWVKGGPELVIAKLKRFDPNFQPRVSGRLVRFEVKRPNVDVTSVTSDVFDYALPGYSRAIQFGNGFNPEADPKLNGIKFTKIDDPEDIPLGEFRWVQLVDLEAFSTTLDAGVETQYARVTPEFVLDTQYPYATGATTVDSPASLLGPTIVSATRHDRFKMYLMWRPISLENDGIPVPLRITEWQWSYDAVYSAANGWTVEGDHSVNPGSQDTTVFPEWNANVEDFPEEPVD